MCIRDRSVKGAIDLLNGDYEQTIKALSDKMLKASESMELSLIHISASQIDDEVLSIINSSYAEAMKLLDENREILDSISDYLDVYKRQRWMSR